MKKTMLIMMSATLLFTSCKKDKDESKEVTYTAYTQQGQAKLKYVDLEGNWNEVNINQNNYTLTIRQVEENYNFSTMLIAQGPDSLHLRAVSEGKSVEDHAMTNQQASINLSIQLSNLK